MTDFVIIAILAVVVVAAARYVIKAKKSGAKCMGCPSGGCNCSGGCCGCGEKE